VRSTSSSTRRLLVALIALALSIALGACGLGLSPRSDVDTPAFQERPSGLAQGPGSTEPPRDVVGVNTDEMTKREREAWWRLATRLYAPCKEQAVSLVACLEEKRPCAACGPMAQLLADKIHQGSTSGDAEGAAAARFGPDVKEVALRDSPSKGPEDALVTIVAFSDFQCPACKGALPLLDQVVAEHPREVRLVHKFYPLPKHTFAKDAAYAAIAAMKQGKYWAMEKTLFANQDALSKQDLDRYAEEIGLDMARYRRDFSDPTTVAMVERDIKDADALGLAYTPFVFINGRLFDTAYFRYDRDLASWVNTELALKKRGAAAEFSTPGDAPATKATPSASPSNAAEPPASAAPAAPPASTAPSGPPAGRK
jgi:protein-disulfide isomerase